MHYLSGVDNPWRTLLYDPANCYHSRQFGSHIKG